jgi:hypothetical protein
MNRIASLQGLIHRQRQIGLNPIELHANRTTLDSFIDEAKLRPFVPQDTRSLLARIRRPEAGPGPQYEFEGVKLVANPKIPGQAIILRPAILMGDPEWLEHHVRFGETPAQPQNGEQGGLQRLPADGSTPWLRKQPNAPQGPQEAAGDPVQQLQSEGGSDCTSILIKAMEGMDSVQDVVVMRFHKNSDVTMCSTMDRMRVVGALQLAMGYVLRQD